MLAPRYLLYDLVRVPPKYSNQASMSYDKLKLNARAFGFGLQTVLLTPKQPGLFGLAYTLPGLPDVIARQEYTAGNQVQVASPLDKHTGSPCRRAHSP